MLLLGAPRALRPLSRYSLRLGLLPGNQRSVTPACFWAFPAGMVPSLRTQPKTLAVAFKQTCVSFPLPSWLTFLHGGIQSDTQQNGRSAAFPRVQLSDVRSHHVVVHKISRTFSFCKANPTPATHPPSPAPFCRLKSLLFPSHHCAPPGISHQQSTQPFSAIIPGLVRAA